MRNILEIELFDGKLLKRKCEYISIDSYYENVFILYLYGLNSLDEWFVEGKKTLLFVVI